MNFYVCVCKGMHARITIQELKTVEKRVLTCVVYSALVKYLAVIMYYLCNQREVIFIELK